MFCFERVKKCQTARTGTHCWANGGQQSQWAWDAGLTVWSEGVSYCPSQQSCIKDFEKKTCTEKCLFWCKYELAKEKTNVERRTRKFPSYTWGKTRFVFPLHTQKVCIASNCLTENESEVQKQYYLITEHRGLTLTGNQLGGQNSFSLSQFASVRNASAEKIKACIDDVQKKW